MPGLMRPRRLLLAAGLLLLCGAGEAAAQQQPCTAMRKINVGVSSAPPNVVHTAPNVAKELGYFAKRCIDATVVQFEGGESAAATAAAVQGTAIIAVSNVAIGRGLKLKQIWGLAPRLPQVYTVSPDIHTAA